MNSLPVNPNSSIVFYGHLNKNNVPKKSYSNLEEAVTAANNETISLKCYRMVPYLCSYCNKYHIGKPNYAKPKS